MGQKVAVSIALFLTLFLFSGCPVSSTSSGGGGGGSSGGGADLLPPGGAGTEPNSLLENPLSSICQTLSGVLYAGSNGGKLLTSSDGSTFTVLDGTKVDIRSAHCDRQSTLETNVWFVGPGGTIVKYDGTALTSETSGTTVDLNAVFGTDKSKVYAVGNEGTILFFDGISWTAQTSGTTEHLMGIAGTNSQAFFVAVGGRATVLQSNGINWDSVDVSGTGILDATLNAVWGDALGGEFFAVGNAGTILHRAAGTNGAWDKQTSPTSLDLLAVHGTSGSQVFAVGKEGVILSYDGSTWTKQTNPAETDFQLNGILSLSSTAALAVGADGTSATSTGILLQLSAAGWAKLL